MTPEDLAALRDVGRPQISPDGEWVAYTVRSSDLKEDKRGTDLWMTRWDGLRSLQLTFTKESESTPRFSPDGRYLSFLSSRGGDGDADQIWLMDRAGGEARRLTSEKGSVEDYVWSPDGRRMVLVIKDPDPSTLDKDQSKDKKTARPIVLDRYRFKEDETGYLDARRQHLYLVEVEGGAVTPRPRVRSTSTSPPGRRTARPSRS